MLVSVIIPTLNRCRLLNRTLFTLCEQVTGHEFEIIVVDNGSHDATREVVEDCADGPGKARIRYFFDDRPGLLIGRNVGARAARGDILSFIDDDVILPPGWIDGIAETFRDEDVHLATGNNHPFFEATPPEWLDGMWCTHNASGRHLYELSLLDLGRQPMDIEPMFVWGLNYHIRKQAYFKAGGFNPDILSREYLMFIGDGETGISGRISQLNYRARFDPRLTLYHTVTAERLTSDYFLRRSYTEGMMRAYTEVRNAGEAGEKTNPWAFLRLPVRAARKTVQIIEQRKKRLENPELSALRDGMEAALKKGYADYLKIFEENSLLMQYVHEENYLDLDRIARKYYGPR